MSTLLLRLAAPLQSWGIASKFDTRDTAKEPTKSGVIGLLAAALGRKRSEGLEDLNNLRFGVRVDQPGTILRDFHTARQNGKESPFVTYRYYLADAVFLAGLEGEKEFLKEIMAALGNPVFTLYLGRRSCPPVGPLVLGLREGSLRQALEQEGWWASEWFKGKRNRRPGCVELTIVCDAEPDEPGAFFRRDLPVSFDQRHRRYHFRLVQDEAEGVHIQTNENGVGSLTNHDVMFGWGE